MSRPLIRTIEDAERDPSISWLVCSSCKSRYPREQWDQITDSDNGGGRLCCDCRCGGFYPDHRSTPIESRFPFDVAGVGGYTALPNVLMSVRKEFGLRTGALALVWAVERERRYFGHAPYLTHEKIHSWTGLGKRARLAAIKELKRLDCKVWQPRSAGGGIYYGNHYDITPLWVMVGSYLPKPAQMSPRWNDQTPTNEPTVESQTLTNEHTVTAQTRTNEPTNKQVVQDDPFLQDGELQDVSASSFHETRDFQAPETDDADLKVVVDEDEEEKRYRRFLDWKDEHAPKAKVTPALWHRFSEQEQAA